MEPISSILTVDDAERAAEAVLTPEAWATSSAAPATSGPCAGIARRSRDFRLRPRVLVDVSSVTTETTVLGTPVSMPITRRPDGLPADRARGGRGRDGARRRRRRDAHVPLDGRDGDAGRHRGGRARRAALAPDLRLPRPRRHGRGHRAGARGGLLGARPDGGPAGVRHPPPRGARGLRGARRSGPGYRRGPRARRSTTSTLARPARVRASSGTT